MKTLLSRSGLVILACAILPIACPLPAGAQAALRMEISFPSTLHADPITGRVFVIISKSGTREPRLQVGFWGGQTPFFGADVEQLKPGQATVIDAGTLGYPADSLKDISAGDYYVQALLNVYTRFNRADGHVIWAHNDQWEGQQFNQSPGNLFSEVQKVRLDPAAGYNLKLTLTEVIPPLAVPQDPMWEIYHGIKINGAVQTNMARPAQDLGMIKAMYYAADLASASIWKDRYELANQFMHFWDSHSSAKPTTKADWCDTWAHHGLKTRIALNYCN